MPEQEYAWLRPASLLSFNEISELVDVFIGLGVDKVRLTGGEPLLRPGLPDLVRMLATKTELEDLALTTNGALLARHAHQLRAAGLHRVTVSLDTLRADRLITLSRRDAHTKILDGIASATEAGFTGTKIDMVVIRAVNDDEITDLLEFGRTAAAEVRYIEYMAVGGATGWTPDQVVSRKEILAAIEDHYGPVMPLVEGGSAPADRFTLADGTTFGIISSTTQPFCATCDRGRLTADGMLYTCLFAREGVDLRSPLRAGASHDELRAMVAAVWQGRRDRGAADRFHQADRLPFVGMAALRADPHLEMHTRGG